MHQVLLLAGGPWQYPLAKFLREKQCSLVLVDPNAQPVCKKFASIHLQLDVRDATAILNLISIQKLTIDFVAFDQSDIAVTAAGKINESLGLKGIKTTTANFFTNKWLMRELVMKIGPEHTPGFVKMTSTESDLKLATQLKFPIIIKPVDSQSSKGIHKLNSSEDLNLELIEKVLTLSLENYVIAEEFIFGQEITIEGICIDGVHHTLAVSRKEHFSMGIASDLHFTNQLDEFQPVIEFHDDFVHRSGLEFGITHAEYFIDGLHNFWLVEIACRGGGTLISSDIVPYLTGLSPYETMFHYFTKSSLKEVKVNSEEKKLALLHFFDFGEGTVVECSGLDQAKSLQNVHEIQVDIAVGQVITHASDDRSRQGFVIIFGSNEEEIKNTLQQIEETLVINVKSS